MIAVRAFLKAIGLGLLFCLLLSGCQSKPLRSAPAEILKDKQLQVATVEVNHDFDPAILIVKTHIPIQLSFHREEPMESCANEVDFPAQRLKILLPNHQRVKVDFPAQSKPGEIPFQCGMNMFHGKIVVQQ